MVGFQMFQKALCSSLTCNVNVSDPHTRSVTVSEPQWQLECEAPQGIHWTLGLCCGDFVAVSRLCVRRSQWAYNGSVHLSGA